MVVGFTTTCAINVRSWRGVRGVLDTILHDKVCQWPTLRSNTMQDSRYIYMSMIFHFDGWFGLWYLTPLLMEYRKQYWNRLPASFNNAVMCSIESHIDLFIVLYLYIFVTVSFIGGGNRNNQKKPPVASYWQTLSHNVASSTPRHERTLIAQVVAFSGQLFSIEQ
jgi:hypothetical protein